MTHQSHQYVLNKIKELEKRIEALEQEPCEDAISRQYLIEKAVSWDRHFADGIRYVALTDILNAPSVTPAEKVGRWYKKPHKICYTCDQCRTTNASGVKYNFCPHCGAKMQEVM